LPSLRNEKVRAYIELGISTFMLGQGFHPPKFAALLAAPLTSNSLMPALYNFFNKVFINLMIIDNILEISFDFPNSLPIAFCVASPERYLKMPSKTYREPHRADPHAVWGGEEGRKTRPYPISPNSCI